MNARFFLLLGLFSTAVLAAPVPKPAQTPDEVVRIQLEALRNNDTPTPDAGIAIVFAFASPPNRAQTGPLSRFVPMLRKDYPDLLQHRQSRLFALVTETDHVVQPVEIVSRGGETFRYLFLLRQYDLPQGKCWLTDGVIGRPAADAPAL